MNSSIIYVSVWLVVSALVSGLYKRGSLCCEQVTDPLASQLTSSVLSFPWLPASTNWMALPKDLEGLLPRLYKRLNWPSIKWLIGRWVLCFTGAVNHNRSDSDSIENQCFITDSSRWIHSGFRRIVSKSYESAFRWLQRTDPHLHTLINLIERRNLRQNKN